MHTEELAQLFDERQNTGRCTVHYHRFHHHHLTLVEFQRQGSRQHTVATFTPL